MSLGGIIAGALGGGAGAVGQIADTQIKHNTWKDQANIEQQLAIERDAAIQRRRLELGRQDSLERATGPVADAELALRARQGQVDTEVQAGRTRAVGTAQGEVERGNQAAYAKPEGKDALKGIQAKADATESSSTKGSRAASTEGTRLDNEDKREDRKLRQQAEEMRARGDEDGAQRIEDRRSRLKGKTGPSTDPKSASDAVASARTFLELAKEAENSGEMGKADAYRRKAEEIALGVAERRQVVKKGEPTPGGSPKEGDTSVSKSGKPVVYTNGRWHYR